MNVEVKPRPQINDDLFNLGSKKLRFEALSFIIGLETSPFLGTPLQDVPEIGDLSDCRKIYFDHTRHRIVYRLLPSEVKPKIADVICVGRREAAEAYIEAVRRLGRAPTAL